VPVNFVVGLAIGKKPAPEFNEEEVLASILAVCLKCLFQYVLLLEIVTRSVKFAIK
jgi:hypothetical protein